MSQGYQQQREVSSARRVAISKALESDQFDWYDDGARFLDLFDIDPEDFVIDEVLAYLKNGYRIYELPDDPRSKSQCCIEWSQDLLIHVKLTERANGDGVFITFGFHRHNTGYGPLPK